MRNDSPKHTVTLEPLRHAVDYEYRIGFLGTDFKETHGKIRTFRSFTDKPAEFSLFYTSGTQFNNEISIQWMKDYIKNCRAAEADIFVHGGDLVNVNNDAHSFYMDKIVNVMTAGKLQSKIFAIVRGNHEYRGTESGEFSRFFGTGENKSYYMFRQGNVCFLVLDSGEDQSRKMLKNYFRKFDRVLIHEQQWLENVVKTPPFSLTGYWWSTTVPAARILTVQDCIFVFSPMRSRSKP